MSIDRYVVIGNPISHSLSPKIHTYFSKQTDEALTYQSMCVQPTDFLNTLNSLFTHGLKGANITSPFKNMAFEYTKNHCSDSAKLSKAVNTLSIKDNHVWGDNTDGVGLLKDLTSLNKSSEILSQWKITGKKILILGAGGAVRGILPALLSENPKSVALYNRSSAKSMFLCQEFRELGNVSPFMQSHESYDFVFNAIPSSEILKADCWLWLPDVLSTQTSFYDLNYSAKINTPFIEKIQQEIQSVLSYSTDGMGMLIEQAAESFLIWRGVRPETGQIKRSLIG